MENKSGIVEREDSELVIRVFEVSPTVDFTDNMCLHMSDINTGLEVTEIGRLAVSLSVRVVIQ
jgi:hypothetical protein